MDFFSLFLLLGPLAVTSVGAMAVNTKRCYACSSYMAQCKNTVDEVKGYAHRGRCTGKCFVRMGEDGAIYRGCFDGFTDVPYLVSNYVGCRNQTWNGKSLAWCMCDTDLCNQASMDSMELLRSQSASDNQVDNSVRVDNGRRKEHDKTVVLKEGYGMEGMGRYDTKVSREGSSENEYIYNYGVQDYPAQYVDSDQGYESSSSQSYDDTYEPLYYQPIQYTYEFYPTDDGGNLVIQEMSSEEQQAAKSSPDAKSHGAVLSLSNNEKEKKVEGSDFENVYITVDLSKSGKGNFLQTETGDKMGVQQVEAKNLNIQSTGAATVQQFPGKTYNLGSIQNNQIKTGFNGYQSMNNNHGNQQQTGPYLQNGVNQQHQFVNQPDEKGQGTFQNQRVFNQANNQLSGYPSKNTYNEAENQLEKAPEYKDPFYFPPHLAQKIECKQTGFYQNPEDCRTFVACILDPHIRRPYMHLMRCPDGLVWDNNEKLCDQYSSTCNSGDMAYYDYQSYTDYSG